MPSLYWLVGLIRLLYPYLVSTPSLSRLESVPSLFIVIPLTFLNVNPVVSVAASYLAANVPLSLSLYCNLGVTRLSYPNLFTTVSPFELSSKTTDPASRLTPSTCLTLSPAAPF